MHMNKEFSIVQPEYYSKFQCDPIQCKETCCERWKIIVDKFSYEKYLQSDNEIIKEIVKTGISLNEAAISADDFALINLSKEMTCPFLNKNNLCEIFIHMGESSLSKTCKSYPRAVLLLNDEIERGLEVSCSVAAERVLLNKKGIYFERIKDTVKMNDLYITIPIMENPDEIEIIKEIRTEIIHMLQTRRIRLTERIARVGFFLNQVLEEIDLSDTSYKEVLLAIKKSKISMGQEDFRRIPDNVKVQGGGQFDYLNTILSMKFKEGDTIRFFSKGYIECLMQVLDAFSKVKNKELEVQYKRNYEKYLRPYLDNKSYILENFLVNYIFIYSSELFRLKNIWNSYLKLCVIYGLLKFNLVGLAVYNKGMNDELALKLIQSLSKTILPDKDYLDSVVRYLREEKLVEFTKILMLIED
ncbi:MAG: flagellin lysine-N-methylase [Thermotaleaceae bacterium]